MLEAGVAVAQHLEPEGRDAPAVEAMRILARKIDAWSTIVEWAERDADETGGRPLVPANDNVSISAFMKGCDALGLTPIGRKNIEAAQFPRSTTDTKDGGTPSGSDNKPEGSARVSSIAARRASAPGSA